MEWNEDKIMQTKEYTEAIEQKADRWVPACGGTEMPFDFRGGRFQYVFNPATGRHGYLNLGTDIVEDMLPT